jgi:predicted aspartyl protease
VKGGPRAFCLHFGRRDADRMSAVLFTLSLAAAAHADCRVDHVLDLPVRVEQMHPIVEAEINGARARLVLDSGASTNLLSVQAARAYRLSIGPTEEEDGVALDGDMPLAQATAASVELGGQQFQNLPFMVGGGGFDRGIDGLIGQDFMADADVDYDLAGGEVSFLHASGCAGRELAQWTTPDETVGMVVLQPVEEGARDVIGAALVNGVPIRVVFDTGGGPSMLSEAAARRVGVSPDDAGARPAGDLFGVAKRPVHTWSVPVKSFEIGGERFSDVRVRVGDWQGSGGDYADMILGGDFFRSHHVLIARSQGRVYFTRNGAPVFDTEER